MTYAYTHGSTKSLIEHKCLKKQSISMPSSSSQFLCSSSSISSTNPCFVNANQYRACLSVVTDRSIEAKKNALTRMIPQ